MNYYVKSKQSGYSMVEVLVAISVLLLAIVGPMTIAARSIQHARFTSEQNTAFFLAQEGVELIYKARAEQGLDHLQNISSVDSWGWQDATAFDNCHSADGCGIDWRDSDVTNTIADCDPISNCRIYFNDSAARARYSHDSSGEVTPFTRVITIDSLSGDAIRVRSVVEWAASGSGDTKQIILETYLHDIYDAS